MAGSAKQEILTRKKSKRTSVDAVECNQDGKEGVKQQFTHVKIPMWKTSVSTLCTSTFSSRNLLVDLWREKPHVTHLLVLWTRLMRLVHGTEI